MGRAGDSARAGDGGCETGCSGWPVRGMRTCDFLGGWRVRPSSWPVRGDAMWRYLGMAAAVHAVWTGAFLVLFTLTAPLDNPWWEAGVRAAVVVMGLCVQMMCSAGPGPAGDVVAGPGPGPGAEGLGLPGSGSGLRAGVPAAGGPGRCRGRCLSVLGLGGGGALGAVFMFTSFFHPVDPVDRRPCPEGV